MEPFRAQLHVLRNISSASIDVRGVDFHFQVGDWYTWDATRKYMILFLPFLIVIVHKFFIVLT
jgi:hypothetical protein